MTFLEELTGIINKYSRENASNTPDFILAKYLEACLPAFETAVQQREIWYGRGRLLYETSQHDRRRE